MEYLIEDIKEKVNESINISLKNLQKIRINSYKNEFSQEYEREIQITKEKIILVNGNYAIEQFKLHKIEKSPGSLYLWIVEEVNNRFYDFIKHELSLKQKQAYF